jgi:phenylacetate-coenzyme A ligase PaaK-like adenylate-forming protein
MKRPMPAPVRSHIHHDGPLTRAAAPFDPWQSVNALWDVWSGSHADESGIERRARWRLRELLAAATAAPLQARRLREAAGAASGDPGRSAKAAHVASRLPLEAIRPIDRAETMAHFDEGCTDRRVTLEGVRGFLADPRRLGEAYLGRYAVWTSSGTTSIPGIYLQDTRALAVYDALESLRLCGLDHPARHTQWLASMLGEPFGAEQRYAMVGATGGHFAGNASVERMRRIWPWAARHARVFSIMQPLPELVRELEAFAPSVIATYPTAAELLAEERLAGRLRLAPREIWLGGEQLGETTRARIAHAFGCRVRESYGASECLSIAWDCDQSALHVNTDWVVLEPVDRAGRPVPPGTASHTVLLTNLANRVQPLIRYDLGDSVTLGMRRCACGSPFPTLRIEGRRDDVLEFDGTHGSVKLLPLALVTVMEDEAQAFDFQLLARDRRTLALRLEPFGTQAAQHAQRLACRHALRAYLDRHGLPGVRIVDDPEPPMREPVSGKLRRVMHAR